MKKERHKIKLPCGCTMFYGCDGKKHYNLIMGKGVVCEVKQKQ